MKINYKQKKLIENYLEHYYSKFSDSNEKLSLKNQIQLIYDYVSHLVEQQKNNNFKTKTMKAINKLREYANLKDDWYVNYQLDLLETEIKIAKNEAKIEVYNEIKNYKN